MGLCPPTWQLRLVILHLKSGDTVSFSTWADGQDYFFRKKGAAHRASVTKFISSLTHLVQQKISLTEHLRHIPKAVTVLFIMTDGLEEIGKVGASISTFAWDLR